MNQEPGVMQKFLHVTEEKESTITEVILQRDLLCRYTTNALGINRKLPPCEPLLHEVLLEVADGCRVGMPKRIEGDDDGAISIWIFSTAKRDGICESNEYKVHLPLNIVFP